MSLLREAQDSRLLKEAKKVLRDCVMCLNDDRDGDREAIEANREQIYALLKKIG